VVDRQAGNDAGAPNGAVVLILGPLLGSAVVAAVVVLAALRPSAIRRRRCRGYVDLTRASRRI
jgi:hypothetical protein